ncbi:hypothetical protein HTV80_34150 [Streptomyces sp. Vc74B-19]|uniref:hypothetical protein n=1 Tax=Streptomyces sp. Vc74B-19 TaxID=2741324 RepID=UPI001BFC6B5B|nr:hypothetical protein [Streptomyces sp. Vc74B-19]MBT3168095.1 hypothetical protein [Streptomyces sp. Vc74B-19]
MARTPNGRREAARARAELLDDLELDLTGGCSLCGIEPDWRCAACGRCNCDRHDDCKRPTGQ